MNPNDSTQTPNSNINQSNGAPFVTPNPIGFSVPQAGGGQAPVQNSAPVPPTPMPAPQSVPVTPTPMPAQGAAFTPTPVGPTVTSNTTPVNPSPTVVEQTKEDPNAKLTEVSIPPSAGNNVAEPQVINTAKSKGSNILLFIIIAILVAFALNIDKMSEMYENYMKTGSLTASKVDPNNTDAAGYIKIDDASSSMKINNINFYNFRKEASDLTIKLNYEAFEKFSDSKSLGIYIELYNNNKELIYKEAFEVEDPIEMNTTSNYTITLEEDIHNDARFALIRQYTGAQLSSKSNMTCKRTDDNYQYENKYYFNNNSLIKYDVSKTSFKDDDAGLEKEYNDLKNIAILDNNTLKYTVNLEEATSIQPEFSKGLTPTVVKNRSALKEWKCE